MSTEIPTVDDLRSAFRLTICEAVAIRGLMEGAVSPDDFPAVKEWLRRCFTPPRLHEQALLAVNAILDASGVESLEVPTAPWDPHFGHIVIDYVNAGDPYVATITRDRKGVWRVEGYGEAVERVEKEYGKESEA